MAIVVIALITVIDAALIRIERCARVPPSARMLVSCVAVGELLISGGMFTVAEWSVAQ